jgi:hypothetical protein
MERTIGRKARVMGIGTEASEYSRMAPSLILGPGDIDVVHKPAESISIRELQEAVGIYERIAKESSCIAVRTGQQSSGCHPRKQVIQYHGGLRVARAWAIAKLRD